MIREPIPGSPFQLCPALLRQYNLVNVQGPTEIFAFADLSELRNGDTIVFEEYLSLDKSGLKLFNQTEISDVQKAPIYQFPGLFVPSGYEMKVTQTRGVSRIISVFVYQRRRRD
jgi:hypothetical protein